MFVLEIQFAVVVRSETVDDLEALLEWLEKAFLLVLSNPEVLPLMPCITLNIDPLSSLSQSTSKTLFLVQDLTRISSDLS